MNLKSVFIFILGVATGAGGMYLALNKKKEAEINKVLAEIDKNKYGEAEPEKKVEEKKEPDLTVYKEVLKKVDYTKVPAAESVTTMTDAVEQTVAELTEKAQEIVGKPKSKKTKVPKKVTQEEFDATPEEDRLTLYFYADSILADEDDNVFDPVETMGATNFKNFKSTYDTVYIFNYATNMMYEVEYSNSRYADIVGGDIDY